MYAPLKDEMWSLEHIKSTIVCMHVFEQARKKNGL